jgi:hypothetical protein
MDELTPTELVLLNNVWDESVQTVLKDIVKCNLTKLKEDFTVDHS